MTIYDQHVHTFLSCDSSESFENYLKIAQKNKISHFVSTEHLDLSCCLYGKDLIVDLPKQERIIAQLQKKYDVKILKGVEIGYKFSRIKDIEKIVKKNRYDVVVMSVHESEIADCTSQIFLDGVNVDEAYSAYLELYINMLENCSCYNIVGHIDYLLRYIDRVQIENHQEKLTKLLNLIIKKEKALEFNTRFIYQYNDDSYLNHIFKLYFKLGGQKVALGSDAHFSRNYMRSFDNAIEILKEIGFTHITTYQNGRETKVGLA